MKPLICAAVACLALLSPLAHAGQATSSFRVSIRVLPQCDASRHGGLTQTADGRTVCVYPQVSEARISPKQPQSQQVTKTAGLVVRTITY
jgi:hypothetical protein